MFVARMSLYPQHTTPNTSIRSLSRTYTNGRFVLCADLRHTRCSQCVFVIKLKWAPIRRARRNRRIQLPTAFVIKSILISRLVKQIINAVFRKLQWIRKTYDRTTLSGYGHGDYAWGFRIFKYGISAAECLKLLINDTHTCACVFMY